MGIFVGVNYGGAKGWKYCWSQRIGRARGEESHACRFFSTRGGVVGPPEGEGESGRHIVSTHGEEKIWRRTVFVQGRGTVHNKSHLACQARYSLKSLKTYTAHTCSYFKVH